MKEAGALAFSSFILHSSSFDMSPILFALIPIAYLAGSIPFGLMVGMAKGVDPRKSGSGNIGATNVGRLLGGKFFALVFTLDLLKGLLPVLAAYFCLRHTEAGPMHYVLWLLIALAAVLGHMFSIFLKFTGGKGVATSTGVTLGLFPYYTIPCLLAASVWMVIFFIWRYISLASIVGSIAFPIIYFLVALWAGWNPIEEQWPLLIFACLVPIMIVYKHRGNLARLRAGTEHRFAKTHHG
ncbi:MAG TPA: glycerol-3-phosphate 1-O-acyltransferase PlsY [Tepidisphaeraceae bacterium]|nr:glycerol-3-phosphate 1-O-acyltransferase PlsY [Tepidisphaeraceae bacterium]